MNTTIILARVDRTAPSERHDVDMDSPAAALTFSAVCADQRRRPGGEIWRLEAIEFEGTRHEPPANDAGPAVAARALSMDDAQWQALMRLAQIGMDATDPADKNAVAAHRALRTHVLQVERDAKPLAHTGRTIL